MNAITTEKINEIRNSVNIVDIVSSYIALTKKGKNYFGVCPFHEDGDPSLSVSPDKQIFSCFSCHTAGNVFTFVKEYEHVSFLEAVKIVADIAGIEFSFKTTNKPLINHDIYNIYEIGQKFYLNNINTKFGQVAKDYLYRRKITDELIKEFEIGLAIKNNKALSNLLTKKEFKEKDLIDSGLIVKDERGFHDFFYDRIMFPLNDLNGKVIGYSGRIYYQSDAPKYINSKEHVLFKKGEYLYNYAKAKNECRIKNTVIIMEGFMDVIRAYSVGVKNVVATLGTAFTKEHANLIRRLANNVIICFDGDQAGAKATVACSELLINLGIIPKVIRLEENLDPDDYILKYGKDKFLDKINNPISIMDFKLSYLKNDKDMTQTVDKAKYASQVIEQLDKIDDEILREITLKKLSQETDLDIEFLKDKLSKKEVKEFSKPKATIKMNKYKTAELGLLYYMLRSGEVIKMFDNRTVYFPTKEYRLLAHEISYFYKNNGYINEADFSSDLDESMIKVFGEVESLDLKEEYTNDLIIDYINAIEEKNIEDEMNRLEKLQREETDELKKAEIGQRIIELKVRGEKNV